MKGEERFHTYVHFDAFGVPFYVGKGTARRVRNLNDRNAWHKRITAQWGTHNIIVWKSPPMTEASAFGMEKFLIHSFKKMGLTLCNLTEGGEGVARPMPEKRKQLMRDKHSDPVWREQFLQRMRDPVRVTKIKANRKPVEWTPKMRQRMSEVASARRVSAETRAKMAVAQRAAVKPADIGDRISRAKRKVAAERFAEYKAALPEGAARICTACKTPLPAEAFGPCKTTLDGLLHQCRSCVAASVRARRARKKFNA